MRRDPGVVSMTVDPVDDGARLTVVAHDRVGLLADVAACLALQRTSVRAARAWDQGEYAVSVWDLADDLLDPAVLRNRLDAIVAGRVRPGERLRPAAGSRWPRRSPYDPRRRSAPPSSRCAPPTSPASCYLVLAALARLGITVRSAHVDTLGPQAVDVFYLQESDAGALSEDRGAEAAHAVRAALDPA